MKLNICGDGLIVRKFELGDNTTSVLPNAYLEAARFLGRMTEAAAAPPQLTEADAQTYQQERSRLVRAQTDLGITRAEIERIRGAYVALFPVDPEARSAELEALKPSADPLSLHRAHRQAEC